LPDSVPDALSMMHVPSPRHLVLAALAGALILGGCSQGGAPAPDAAQQQAQAKAAEAARNLDTYRQLLRIHNDQMSATLGQDIVQRFPGSAAAKEVQQTLPEVEQRWKENSEKARLAALWQYQVAPMAGGTQSTAATYNSRPIGVHDRGEVRRQDACDQGLRAVHRRTGADDPRRQGFHHGAGEGEEDQPAGHPAGWRKEGGTCLRGRRLRAGPVAGAAEEGQ